MELVLADPLPVSRVKEFQSSSGYVWSPEFFELYTQHDGVGLRTPEDGELIWGFVPTSELPSFAASVRHWFERTHPEVAKAFFPFFDWYCGDAIGYLRWPGIKKGTLVEFDHDYYEFKPGQPWREFLRPSHDSIMSFLKV